MSESELDEVRVARIREAFASVPYAKFLGLELGEMKPGEASIHLAVRDELRQNQGVVHGGAVASLIDTASAFAVVTQLEPNERVTTTDLTIHYLRPVTAGRLTATARTVRAGRRLFVLSVEVMDDHQRLIATAVTTYIKLQ
ncbi:MAG TPA: PaaI family thioesterase [Pyrinomonadaceae bacterium]|nr:PaaI family thioesterase [Pyrinomonadaceae bacterium]